MTVVLETQGNRYIGLSTDAKPTIGVMPGRQFYETDTGKTSEFDGAAWQALDILTLPAVGSVQRVSAGYLAPGQSAKSYTGQAFTPATCAAPAAPTLADHGAAGALSAGSYLYKVTFVSAAGESQGGATSAPIVLVISHSVDLSVIPLGPAGTTARKIYRTKANGHDGSQLLAATIADNTSTTVNDNTADASLGVAYPVRNAWAAPLTIALGTVTALKTWLATDIFVSTDSPNPIDVQLQAAGSPIFRSLVQASSPVDAAGIETQPNAAAGNALTLVIQGTGVTQTVDYTLEAIEQ